MKNQNKIYLPLREQGIKKAWDKVAIFRAKEDKVSDLQMVVYYKNKPFVYWYMPVKFGAKDIELALHCMLDYYGGLSLNSRVNSKRITKYFISYYAKEKVVTYKRCEIFFGGVK